MENPRGRTQQDVFRRQLERGFTLIELLLVLVILATLAAVVVPKFTKRSEQARITASRTDIANLEVCLDAFEIDTGRYPTTEEGLGALVEPPAGIKGWHDSYIKRGIPKDPWGNPYVYPGFPSCRWAPRAGECMIAARETF